MGSKSISNNIIPTIKQNKVLTLLVTICAIFVLILPVNLVSKTFVIAAAINFYIFTLYFGNVFNLPSLFMTLFLFMIGCSQAKLSPIEQNDFNTLTWLTLAGVIAAFYATIIFYQKIIIKKAKPVKEKSEYSFSGRTVLLTNIIILLTEAIIYYVAFKRIGGIPLFDDYLRAITMTNVLGNWIMTLMVLPIFLIIYDTIYMVHTRKYQYFGFIIAFLSLIILLGGRINIFIPVITALFYIALELYFKVRKKKRLVFIGSILLVLVVTLMIAIPLLRTSIYSGSGANYYDAIYTVEENAKDNAEEPPEEIVDSSVDIDTQQVMQLSLEIPSFLKPIWVNLSTELYGFDGMVEILSNTGEFQYGRMFLRGTFNFVFKYFVDVSYGDILKFHWLNVLTFMQKPYLDFGIFGVIAFIIAFTFAGMHSYHLALKRKSIFTMVFYAYYCMCTLFFVFDNHFYYTTFIVNTILLFLFSWGLSIDWIQKVKDLFSRSAKKIITDRTGKEENNEG